jgi:cobalamin-dependent methionine synthase I
MILAADNLNPMNPAVARAMELLDPEPIKKIVLQAQQAGAKIIDVNPGHLSKRNRDRMTFLVETVRETAPLRLMLDSPDPEVLAVGMASCLETPILNALTLEERKLAELLPLAVASQADLVVLLLDERSMAPIHLENKISLAVELFERCREAGLPLDKLIFDPFLPTLGQPDSFFHAAETVKAVRLLSAGAVFREPVRTMVGMSNLRSGQRKVFPVQLEGVALSVLGGAGLDVALMDMTQEILTATAGVANRFL